MMSISYYEKDFYTSFRCYKLLGLTLTAIYNNYFVIFTGLISFVGIISAAFTGGVGNHVATRTVKENYDEKKKLDFVYLWLGGWFTVCL